MHRHPLDQYQFEKAKSLQEAGNLDQAEKTYRELLERRPDDFQALNNLGIVLEAAGRFTEAEWAYRRAVALSPESAVIHYNLGHLFQHDGRLDMARDAYREALRINPGHFKAAFNLGLVLRRLQEPGEAAEWFEAALRIDPRSVGALGSLGEILYERGEFSRALEVQTLAVELDPQDAEAHFRLALTLQALGRHDEASGEFRRSVELNPDSRSARESLGHSLATHGRHEEAVDFFREWLRREPESATARHMLASLTGEAVPDRASDDYILATYEQFAGDFDAVLTRLDYRGPEILFALYVDHGHPQRGETVLDAGCGTGRCGKMFRPWAGRLVGLDLSPQMLARARERGCYDELVEGELSRTLMEQPAQYDVVLCADTLVYFGNLEAPLRAAATALKPGGRFLFSLEHLDSDSPTGFQLKPNGRFAHTEAYVRETAESAGLRVDKTQISALRTEAGRPVMGLIVLASRPEDGA